MESTLIPPNTRGKHNDLSNSRDFAYTVLAEECFHRVKTLLLHPGRWQELAGKASAWFELFTREGERIFRPAQKGDLFRIDLPGPGPSAGGGYDWVQLDAMESLTDPSNGDALFALRLVTTPKPGQDDAAAAHFFKAGAISVFVLKKQQHTITLSYHGRNETPNTDAAKLTDKLRNLVAGEIAMAGVSEMQWSALIKGMLWEENN